jgi:putative transposase
MCILCFPPRIANHFWSTPTFASAFTPYLKGVCDNHGSPSLRIGGVEDHVHILCRLSKTLDVSALIRELKRDSSKWMKDENPRCASFYWQNGYGAFSISPSHVEPVKAYIGDQIEQHRQETYQDELRRLCKKYDVELDERYVWD